MAARFSFIAEVSNPFSGVHSSGTMVMSLIRSMLVSFTRENEKGTRENTLADTATLANDSLTAFISLGDLQASENAASSP